MGGGEDKQKQIRLLSDGSSFMIWMVHISIDITSPRSLYGLEYPNLVLQNVILSFH